MGDEEAKPRRRPRGLAGRSRWTVQVSFRIPADLDEKFQTLYDGVDHIRSQAARKAFTAGVEKLLADRATEDRSLRPDGEEWT